MNIKPIALFISLAVLSGTALADAPKARHDWTGFYVGGFAGGGAGAKASPAEPLDSSPGGFGLWWDANNGQMNSYRTNSSVMGGGTVGYNWQLGRSPYLVGLEGEYGYLGMQGSASDPNNTSLSNEGYDERSLSSTKIGGSYGYGVIGGRLGYAHDRSLFYVKSGAVFTSAQSKYYNIDFSDDFSLQTSSKTSNDVGYAIGGGIEQAIPPEWFKLAKNISIKAEYLFLGIGRNLQATGVGFDATNCGGTCGTFSHTDRIGGIHTAKIGINYRFRGL